MMGAGPDRRTFLAGGASLVAGATMARSVAAQHAADYAVFTELSTELKAMKAGWNRRLFTNIDTRKGNAIQGDMATGIVTVAPGVCYSRSLPAWCRRNSKAEDRTDGGTSIRCVACRKSASHTRRVRSSTSSLSMRLAIQTVSSEGMRLKDSRNFTG